MSEKLRKAHTLIDLGMECFKSGKVEESLSHYEASLEVQETAEAYTYIALSLSHQGDLDQAIEFCEKAIEVDPDFGTPYNDIGFYLMKQDKLDRAIHYLERAKRARLEPRHQPYMNLGRIYLSRCEFPKALKEFEVALEHDPANTELKTVVHRIREINAEKSRDTH